ncbi:MAG: RNA polymerase sigma-54 factor, partial [Alphaproteobacteria bacterium]|nr:RNA polymerase sigma-54 factor [Alphaproteobacteria bacterium]
MAIGPRSSGLRLDLRQSQSLVMTPQLRQAIKLLQSSNLEVAAFVEEELERNPLLERDERPEPAMEDGRRADILPVLDSRDSAAAAAADSLPSEAAAPLDADWSNVHDEGTPFSSSLGAGGRSDFGDDLSTIENLAGREPTLREHVSEQIRLGFREPREQLIASAMLAMLEPSGRLVVDVAAMAA